MSNRMSAEAHTVYLDRRNADRERTINRRAARVAKRGAVAAFGGGF